MKIELWLPSMIASPEGNQLKARTPVYTMRLMTFCGEPTDGNLCDQCWTVKSERLNHFWYSDELMKHEIKKPVTVTLGEYLATHLKTISAMTPFWTLSRVDFMNKWNSLPR